MTRERTVFLIRVTNLYFLRLTNISYLFGQWKTFTNRSIYLFLFIHTFFLLTITMRYCAFHAQSTKRPWIGNEHLPTIGATFCSCPVRSVASFIVECTRNRAICMKINAATDRAHLCIHISTWLASVGADADSAPIVVLSSTLKGNRTSPQTQWKHS